MAQQERILLVEDEPAHARLVREAFRRQECSLQLEVTHTLEEARSRIAEGGCGLVLADYLLGDGHGSELIPIDAEAADYGVVLLTSQGDEAIAVEAMKSGAVDYVVKSPETFQALPRICERALENRRLVREQREAEHALRRSEYQLRLALQASQSAAWDFDVATGTILWSREAARLTGLTVTGQCSTADEYLRLVHPDDRPTVAAAWRSLLETDDTAITPVRVEHRLASKDEARWFELRGRVIELTGAGPRAVAGTLTDITTRKRADEELKQKEAELAHVARLATLGELLAGIAHELNQPLTAIRNYVAASNEFLGDKHLELHADGSQLREWHTHITEASDLAAGIIRRLRSLVARRPSQRSRVDILELIQSTRALLQSAERAIGVNVGVSWDQQNSEVEVDAIQIQQVLLNLLRNSFDAVLDQPPEQRNVEVRVESAAGWLKLSVSDSGRGLPPGDFDQVFESFFTTRENGLGMGLAISRSIVEAHRGRIRALSRPGAGATFSVELPQPECTAVSPNNQADVSELPVSIAGPHFSVTRQTAR